MNRKKPSGSSTRNGKVIMNRLTIYSLWEYRSEQDF